jgi:hypothetical protein
LKEGWIRPTPLLFFRILPIPAKKTRKSQEKVKGKRNNPPARGFRKEVIKWK